MWKEVFTDFNLMHIYNTYYIYIKHVTGNDYKLWHGIHLLHFIFFTV